jgi:hypothetical protein
MTLMRGLQKSHRHSRQAVRASGRLCGALRRRHGQVRSQDLAIEWSGKHVLRVSQQRVAGMGPSGHQQRAARLVLDFVWRVRVQPADQTPARVVYGCRGVDGLVGRSRHERSVRAPRARSTLPKPQAASRLPRRRDWPRGQPHQGVQAACCGEGGCQGATSRCGAHTQAAAPGRAVQVDPMNAR